MDLSVVLVVYPVIFVGELPDKTFVAGLVLATRGRPLLVWAGSASALGVHVVIAVSVGATVLRALPKTATDVVVAALFLLGAVLLARPEPDDAEQKKDEELVARESAHHKTFATTFIVIFLAEWGDVTQVLMADLAARYHAPVSVGVGSLAALWSVAGLAVVGGRGLLRVVPVATVRRLAAVLLVALALATLRPVFF